MQYMLLIYLGDDYGEPKPGTPEFNKYLQGYGDLNQEMQKKGQLINGNALQNVTTATTVRVRSGKSTTTDGPFAETKEQLAGYFLVDCKDLDEAIEYAAKIPGAKYGSIEIRPVMVFE